MFDIARRFLQAVVPFPFEKSPFPQGTEPSKALDLNSPVGDAVAAQMPLVAQTHSRLGYLDWLRGLACLLMFQTHCYDSWLGGAARQSSFLGWSRLLGT